MGQGSGPIASTVALIVAICLLWVYPFCLVHQANAAAYQRVIPSNSTHDSSPLAPCDDSHLYVTSNSQVSNAGAKAGIGHQVESLRAVPREQCSFAGRHTLTGPLFPASRSASLSPSKGLYALYVVYQI